MGLDTVELVLDLEDRFGVTLPDAECGRTRTVADVAALVLTHMPRAATECPTAARFYEVRRAMVEHLGVPRGRVRPRTPVAEFAHPGTRSEWNALRRAERQIPELTRSPRGDRASAVLTLALLGLTFAGLAWVGVRVSGWAVLGVLPVALGVLVAGLAWAASRLARHAPAGVATVGDLVRATAPLPPPGGSPGERLIAEQRVLEEVRRMVASTVGLPVEQVRAESRLVEDLKMN
jgi:acyl carrier protein